MHGEGECEHIITIKMFCVMDIIGVSRASPMGWPLTLSAGGPAIIS